jgi:hypothetical protein
MGLIRFVIGVIAISLFTSCAAELPISDDLPLLLPEPGSYGLHILSPTILELILITTKKPDPVRVERWDFVNGLGKCRLPQPQEFVVSAAGKPVEVKTIGFKRRVLYAPFKQRDLRIGNYLYLQLATALEDNQEIEVKNPGNKLWPASAHFIGKTEPLRWSPIIHVNQTGYLASYPKKAMIGYYLGSLGEMEIASDKAPASLNFQLIEAATGKNVFQGSLTPRRDRGFPFESYQRVLQADFSAFKTPGEYRLWVPKLGASFPFTIDDSVAGAFARSYALGIYHQRCGAPNDLPFTRFTHKECHTAPAEVPNSTKKFESVNDTLSKETANYKDNPRHTAPPLKNVSACLYPFQNRGPVDVRGGHHDAGDYSKYTINSAAFIHQLIFAVDVFPGVSELDNLGLPESGDGKSDVLQEAKWEADFLAKMQDADGGFYFLVYPRDREYENDVLPDHGDPQVVFPKTTAATAAATAALAQCASSPTLKKQFPEVAALYLEKAKKGWDFLERAEAKFGKDGSYQKVSHYGDYFLHDDEKAWAACELFLATGDSKFQDKLIAGFDPSNPDTRLWSWLRLFDAYGNTIRSYAFAVKAGKIKRNQLQDGFFNKCEAEIAAAGEDQLRRAQSSAYGTSFPEETKRVRNAGWYFSGDAAFDLAVAYQLDYPRLNDPRPKLLEALISNLNYEQGCNPVNVTYLTGLGWKRQREIVHQYAQNDRRVLPPTGIPLGNIQAGFGWLELYQRELGNLSFPSDSDELAPYPFYDRWGDSFNLSTEFVILNQARSLGYLAWLMAQTPLKNQSWKPVSAQITGVAAKSSAQSKPTVELTAPGIDLTSARIVWEASGQEPVFGKSFSFSPGQIQWLEAEAQLPDGRRVFAATNFTTMLAK